MKIILIGDLCGPVTGVLGSANKTDSNAKVHRDVSVTSECTGQGAARAAGIPIGSTAKSQVIVAAIRRFGHLPISHPVPRASRFSGCT